MNIPRIPNVKIAVVEDHSPTRELLVNTLMYCVNRDIMSFDNCRDAWQAITSNGSVDIVLADIDMPEMSGLELLTLIKDQYPEKVCIMMSGRPTHESAVRTLGGDAFLAKPFSIHDLFDLVQAYVVGHA